MMRWRIFFASLLTFCIALGLPIEAFAYRAKMCVQLGMGNVVNDNREMTIHLPVGLQIFGLPGVPANPVSAWLFHQMVRGAGGNLTLFTRLNPSGKFQPYLRGITPDFNLLVGKAYLIKNAKACSIKLRIADTKGDTGVSLLKGINFFSVPSGGPYSASSLLADLDASGAASNYVLRVENGRFDLYCPALGTSDFEIENGRGYIVGSARAVRWIPKFLASKGAGRVQTNAVASKTSSKAPQSLELEQAVVSQMQTQGQATNRTPILLSLRPVVLSGKVLTGRLVCLDLDGDALTFTASSTPSGFSFNPKTGEYRWDVPKAKKGRHQIVFRVSDGKATATQTGVFIR